MNRTSVYARTEVEGFHHWPNAPETVKFLRDRHRHMFHIRAGAYVTETDRQVEFILMKREIVAALSPLKSPDGTYDFKSMSCEDIAIYLWHGLNYSGLKVSWVDVSEDGENGAVHHG